jgi:hypothetical protein
MTRREALQAALGWRLAGLLPSSPGLVQPDSGTHRTASIVVPPEAAEPVLFGAREICRRLEQIGLTARVTDFPVAAALQIQLQARGSTSRGDHKLALLPPSPEAPESFALEPVSPRLVIVEGSDTTGLMYGCLELAEQLSHASPSEPLSRLCPTRKVPFLQVRGINMFLTTQDIESPKGAFWSEEYWRGYFDMMARNRYNFLDIHGPCDAVTLSFPNAFSYFVYLPEFPEVGVGAKQAALNMAQLQRIIRWAGARGIKVGFMNYEVSPTLGPWKTRRFGTDERWTPVAQAFLTGPRLEAYTRRAVTSFLGQAQNLWMFGFRIGESGQGEDFYRKTFLAALSQFPSSLNVYTRTWLADPAKVRLLPQWTNHRVFLEIKYNGEHLGLPYQAVLGGRFYAPSGSYESYTDCPKDYSIIWQIRAHGTHRIFSWAWPEFARRVVRSCKFGGGVGFSMEPMDAYNPAADYLHNNPDTNHGFYHWMYEREWPWHLVWGRTAYDPDVGDQVFVAEFARRLGDGAGPLAFEALVEASRIVPFIYAYHNVGLDHQDFAPELENGDHALGARGRFWDGSRVVPAAGDNRDFLSVGVLDRTAMIDPASYASLRLEGRASGKMTPEAAADYLEVAAGKSLDAVERATRYNSCNHRNLQCIEMDVRAVAHLGHYYAHRIRSATHLEFYRRTSHHPELDSAYLHLNEAAWHWEQLCMITEQHFGYVPDYIRMGVPKFRWRQEQEGIGADLEALNGLEAEFRKPEERTAMEVIVGHVPPLKIRPGKPFRITATLPASVPSAQIYVFYSHSPEQGYGRMIPLRLENEFARTWVGEIPAKDIEPGRLYYFFEVGIDRELLVSTLVRRPPYVVWVNENEARPLIAHRPPSQPLRGPVALLIATVQTKARIEWVRLHYKLMPSYYDWLSLEMTPAGGDEFHAQVPLTPEGILYYFEATDVDGNTTQFPDFMKETPYFVIQGCNAAEAMAGSVPDRPSLRGVSHCW